jgi:para-aminobenzoate synthetase component 1
MRGQLQGSSFWMGGLLASNPLEISHDPADLNRPGFWAVVATFEGHWTCIRFGEVVEAPFPPHDWQPVVAPWVSNFERQSYLDYVERIRQLIASGQVYQVNACRLLRADHAENLAGLFSQIQDRHPSPYSAYFKGPNIEIASASPELFLKIEMLDGHRYATSSPIKGTSRMPNFGLKDSAENIMIVDLIRNDLSQLCVPGTVEVPRLLATEEHPGLFHLVSDVKGRLQPQIGWSEIAEAMLPAGSISGAPKSSALKVIHEEEADARGPYCGIVGWVNEDKALLSVGIRLFWKADAEHINFGTGAGITWASVASDEWDETELKASRLMEIANGRIAP